MTLAVLVTIPPQNARDLARRILEERLCACVNIIKEVDSLFWWEDKIEEDKEYLMIIKTTDSLFEDLKKTIEANHPYEVPEIIALEVNKISPKYLNWLNKELDA